MSLKIVFAGTPDFSAEILKALLASKHTIIGVYTQPDRPAGRGRELKVSPVKELALQHNIPVYQPLSLKTVSDQSTLTELHPDLMVVAAYGLILPKNVLTIPKHGCINVHTSLLPRWRGASPIQHAILANDKETGVSIMQMNVGLDTGDVLFTARCKIQNSDTTKTLEARLITLGAKALLDTLELLEEKKLSPITQVDDNATYAPKISKEEAKINWEESAFILDRKIRAFNPWPVAFTELQGQMVRIWEAIPLSIPSNAVAGTIIQTNKDGIEVATGEGILRLLSIQLPGKKELCVKDILNSKSTLFQPGNIFS